jgi:hypothetical protein
LRRVPGGARPKPPRGGARGLAFPRMSDTPEPDPVLPDPDNPDPDPAPDE